MDKTTLFLRCKVQIFAKEAMEIITQKEVL